MCAQVRRTEKRKQERKEGEEGRTNVCSAESARRKDERRREGEDKCLWWVGCMLGG